MLKLPVLLVLEPGLCVIDVQYRATLCGAVCATHMTSTVGAAAVSEAEVQHATVEENNVTRIEVWAHQHARTHCLRCFCDFGWVWQAIWAVSLIAHELSADVHMVRSYDECRLTNLEERS